MPPLPRSHRSSLLRGSAVEPVAGQQPRLSRPPLRPVVSGRARGPEMGDPEMDGAALREMKGRGNLGPRSPSPLTSERQWAFEECYQTYYWPNAVAAAS
ncbi:hypothetical protein ROHU_031769 [Labeo rohita]|uniref:Uncharacterized protein n=1 Tax=Labeo rohita TaxID=84645 RepID=A0A498LSS9_LABRO|nr:hypothetical protein ROHU_031769 [Labeo rohita]